MPASILLRGAACCTINVRLPQVLRMNEALRLSHSGAVLPSSGGPTAMPCNLFVVEQTLSSGSVRHVSRWFLRTGCDVFTGSHGVASSKIRKFGFQTEFIHTSSVNWRDKNTMETPYQHNYYWLMINTVRRKGNIPFHHCKYLRQDHESDKKIIISRPVADILNHHSSFSIPSFMHPHFDSGR